MSVSRLLRHPFVPFFLFVITFAPANGGQVQWVDKPHPGGSGPTQVGPPGGSGPGPQPACTKCNYPKGYSPTPSDSAELCTNKNVSCTCDGVKSTQPMCLYVIDPGPPNPSKGPVAPLK